MEFDRQAIEKRDFPIARRGYDPAAVDAHLRALAAEIEELQRAAGAGAPEASLASAAGNQVQSILAAAETAAADIERQARESASSAREEADRDAARTRSDAIEQARAHVAVVAQGTAVLLERVSAMDAEVSGLSRSLQTGAGRLAADLAAVETNMGELYDAASGSPAPAPAGSPARMPAPARAADPDPSAGDPPVQAVPAPAASPPPTPAPAPTPAPPLAPADGELDSARLVALNMALNGESRTEAERYLAEHFELTDREKLVEEVYAAIEG